MRKARAASSNDTRSDAETDARTDRGRSERRDQSPITAPHDVHDIRALTATGRIVLPTAAQTNAARKH